MKRGPAPKPRAPKTRGHAERVVTLATSSGPAPEPPEDWLAETKRAWEAYWSSPLAQRADLDAAPVRVYFATLDEWERCIRAGRKQRVVPGSKGQPVLSPLLDRADKLAALLPRLAAEIGMSPLARSRLAVDVAAAARTIEDLSREAEDDDGDDDDPRLVIAAEDE